MTYDHQSPASHRRDPHTCKRSRYLMRHSMQCQTYGYLPSGRTSVPCGWYQIILLGEWVSRGTCIGCEQLAQGRYLAVERSHHVEPQAKRPNQHTTQARPALMYEMQRSLPTFTPPPPKKTHKKHWILSEVEDIYIYIYINCLKLNLTYLRLLF